MNEFLRRRGPTAYRRLYEFLGQWTAPDGRAYSTGDFETDTRLGAEIAAVLLKSGVIRLPVAGDTTPRAFPARRFRRSRPRDGVNATGARMRLHA